MNADLRQALRDHAALPGLPNWCSCGHRGENNYQRETHLVEMLGGVL